MKAKILESIRALFRSDNDIREWQAIAEILFEQTKDCHEKVAPLIVRINIWSRRLLELISDYHGQKNKE
jgi:hypothetical protein